MIGDAILSIEPDLVGRCVIHHPGGPAYKNRIDVVVVAFYTISVRTDIPGDAVIRIWTGKGLRADQQAEKKRIKSFFSS